MVWESDVAPIATRVALVLMAYKADGDGHCHLAADEIADYCCITPHRVERCLDQLTRERLIDAVDPRPPRYPHRQHWRIDVNALRLRRDTGSPDDAATARMLFRANDEQFNQIRYDQMVAEFARPSVQYAVPPRPGLRIHRVGSRCWTFPAFEEFSRTSDERRGHTRESAKTTGQLFCKVCCRREAAGAR